MSPYLTAYLQKNAKTLATDKKFKEKIKIYQIIFLQCITLKKSMQVPVVFVDREGQFRIIYYSRIAKPNPESEYFFCN